jgi:hypothetical protein
MKGEPEISGSIELVENLWPSPEQQLLLEAALSDGPRAVEAYRRWREGVDLDADFGWPILRLLPMVYHNLHRMGFDDPLMGRLKGVYRRAWVENNQLFHRVRPIVEELTRRGIGVMMLKGAPLVLGYYRNWALRPMADADVVVRMADAREAVECLDRAGWRFIRHVDDDMLRFHHAVQCFGPDGGELDLHWHVTYEAGTETADDAFWDRAEPLDFMGLPVLQLDPTALLLHTVIHGVRWNEDPPIRWIPDALAVLRARGAEVDWKRAVELALQIQSPVRFRMGLDYLRGSFGAEIPRWVMDALPSSPVSLRERIDNSVLLRDPAVFEQSALRWQWVLFAEYCRRYWARGPFDFVIGFSHYLRFQWSLDGRREILPLTLRGIWRRLARPGPSAPPAPPRSDLPQGSP